MKKTILIIIFLVLFAISGYALYQQYKNLCVSPINNQPISSNPITSQSKWTKPLSTDRGYPIFDKKSENLYVYNISKGILLDTKYKSLDNSGAAGYGETKAIASDDYLYIAFMPAKGEEIRILTPYDNKTIEVPESKFAEYITGWIPGSHKLIYYIPVLNVSTVKTGMGGMINYNDTETFYKNRTEGFIMFDLDTGKSEVLSPLTYIETIQNSDNIITRTAEPSPQNDRLVVFNILDYTANYSLVKDTFGFGTNQLSFSKDGKKWAFTDGINENKQVNIIFADFPFKQGTVVDTADWAWVQWPKVSPKGDKLAYQKRQGYSQPSGNPQDFTFIYDPNTKTSKMVHEGTPDVWIDNENLIIRDSYKPAYYLTNTTNGDTKKIY